MRFLIFVFALTATLAQAQEDASKWYEKLQLKGYAHLRYNRLLETNKELTCTACDKSLGDKQGFFIRRARLVLSGEIDDRVYFYFQPDFASDGATASSSGTASTQQNFVGLRDLYFDYALTEQKEWRLRAGSSKIPFGWENMQSSSNRPSIDRSDAINSGIPNERDLGLFLMYATPQMRQRFKELTSNHLKGTGDYGLIALGAYNGQGLNKPEKNNDLHRVVRLTYPIRLESGQFFEAAGQFYEGKFNATDGKDYYDGRWAGTFIIYPQPLGLQVEYSEGQGPEYDPTQDKIRSRRLHGGYVQVNYQLYVKDERLFPYVRYQKYDGGKKADTGSPLAKTEELEFGTEWQPNPAFELTGAFALSDRETQSSPINRTHEKGQLLRLQAQFNY